MNCIELQTSLRRMSANLRNQGYIEDGVNFAHVDCNIHSEICQSQYINDYYTTTTKEQQQYRKNGGKDMLLLKMYPYHPYDNNSNKNIPGEVLWDSSSNDINTVIPTVEKVIRICLLSNKYNVNNINDEGDPSSALMKPLHKEYESEEEREKPPPNQQQQRPTAKQYHTYPQPRINMNDSRRYLPPGVKARTTTSQNFIGRK